MTSPSLVHADMNLSMVVPGGRPLSVRAKMRYDPADPYAVQVEFMPGGGEPVRWTFARQLLTDGTTGMAGVGDVQVWPVGEGRGALVRIGLSSPSGQAQFEVPLVDVVTFLNRTYAAVPTGAETHHMRIDDDLAMLLS